MSKSKSTVRVRSTKIGKYYHIVVYEAGHKPHSLGLAKSRTMALAMIRAARAMIKLR